MKCRSDMGSVHTPVQARVLLGSQRAPAAYMRMHYVSSAGTQCIAQQLRQAEADGVAGIIIDLRNNPGAPSCVSVLTMDASEGSGVLLKPCVKPCLGGCVL